MDTNDMLLWALAICVGIVTVLSVPHYIFGGDAIASGAIKIFSFLLGAVFVVYIIYALMTKSWGKYSGIASFAFWAGMIAAALLCLTGLLIFMVTMGISLPQSIAQSIIPLRIFTFYLVIALGVVCLGLLSIRPKTTTA
ncbi:MAG: hypothetical protein A7316_00295 [Candidatus Altiarchaeales archaeon WOR_SM1_86-2]|nr:MAG: hypothetical protein A7316_00295 [Candidatus Altiarchaeales archaeon WOR_SM1_86-2]ODS41727.1 MAG: hypothetical protein A7315_00385 [Candidatus Altiarchaeales archaeon WOR_SM1_79]